MRLSLWKSKDPFGSVIDTNSPLPSECWQASSAFPTQSFCLIYHSVQQAYVLFRTGLTCLHIAGWVIGYHGNNIFLFSEIQQQTIFDAFGLSRFHLHVVIHCFHSFISSVLFVRHTANQPSNGFISAVPSNQPWIIWHFPRDHNTIRLENDGCGGCPGRVSSGLPLECLCGK